MTAFNYAEYSRNALAKAAERHAANGQDMLASFTWDESRSRFVVEVMHHIVSELKTIAEVSRFSTMHNREF